MQCLHYNDMQENNDQGSRLLTQGVYQLPKFEFVYVLVYYTLSM